MNKKTKTGGKRIKLSLGKETVASLTSDMLEIVAGGLDMQSKSHPLSCGC